MISIWVTISEMKKYEAGVLINAWSKQNPECSINMLIPSSELIVYFDYGENGYQFMFKKK